MRSRFDEQLTQLNNSLIEMGALVEHTITQTTKALQERDVDAARKIIVNDVVIDEKEKEIESMCLRLILHQQPVARDLRQISTVLKMITEIARIGDQAADISERCAYLDGQKLIKDLEHIPQMAEATTKMVVDSINAFVNRKLDLAQAVIAHDDVVDELYVTIKKDLINLIHADVGNGEQAFDLLRIAKYYERIGDHAVNIAEWVIFFITGKHQCTQVL